MKYCAACGRSDEPGPDGADPVSDMYGRLWCRRCADVRKTDSGNTYIAEPSPGRMIDHDAKADPVEAWRDCYSKPKKKILEKNAKVEVQRAWRLWEGDKAGEASMSVFYGWLLKNRPYFLTFNCKRDRWQMVHLWLEAYEREYYSCPD